MSDDQNPTGPTPPAPPAGQDKPKTTNRAGSRPNKHKAGDVIKTGEGAYGIVVGYQEQAHHTVENDGTPKTERKMHPLVIALPGEPRRVETETEATS